MASTSVDLLAPVHRLSVEQYVRIAETGLFDSGPRVELIDGVIVEMSPIGYPHLHAVTWLNRALVPQLAEAHVLSAAGDRPRCGRCQNPTSRSSRSQRSSDGVAGRPLLVIEVSDSSLRFDRITKSRLYARHGIPEYWIVNVADEVVEVHLEPAGDAWASRTVHGAGAVFTPDALPGVTVVVDELLAFMAGRP